MCLRTLPLPLALALPSDGSPPGSATCRSYWPSSRSRGTCGASCARPTPSNAASLKSGDAPKRWSCSPTSKASTGSSMPVSADSMRTGKLTPSNYLHTQLDVTAWATPHPPVSHRRTPESFSSFLKNEIRVSSPVRRGGRGIRFSQGDIGDHFSTTSWRRLHLPRLPRLP